MLKRSANAVKASPSSAAKGPSGDDDSPRADLPLLDRVFPRPRALRRLEAPRALPVPLRNLPREPRRAPRDVRDGIRAVRLKRCARKKNPAST